MPNSADNIFFSLPRDVQNMIDEAFNLSVSLLLDSDNLSKDHESQFGGGFIQESENIVPQGRLLLSEVPSALQRLNLPSDDQEILSVFRNAAIGWVQPSTGASSNQNSKAPSVSLDDWRSVCAVLLERTISEADAEDTYEQSDNDDDIYTSDIEISSPGESDDEYVDEPRARRTRGSASKQGASTNSRNPGFFRIEDISPKQREECLQTFALFFPNATPDDLPNQRISLSDIQRVSNYLGEKIKAEEMVDMLQMFSTSPDRMMNLDDFCSMMIAAELL